jgi:pantoate--beta-alanine ligase
MSSRNQLLKNNERMLASMIYQVLKIAKEKAATMSPQQVIAFVQKYFDDIPEFTLEYFTIVDSQNLLPIVSWKNAHEPRGLIAVYLNEVRLIDNIVF